MILKDSLQRGNGDRLDATPIPTDHRGCRHQGVEDGFLRGFDRCGEKGVEMRIGQTSHRKSRSIRIMRNNVAGRKGQHEISTPMMRRRSRPG